MIEAGTYESLSECNETSICSTNKHIHSRSVSTSSQGNDHSQFFSDDEIVFYKTFNTVPHNEKLVKLYQCSVIRSKMVRMGKLYLTGTRMCFISTFIKDPIHILWETVTSIEKKGNFLMESIVVKTGGIEVTEGSLSPGNQTNGDKTPILSPFEEERFTAFLYSGTDQAFKMMKMLCSVCQRYITTDPPVPSNVSLPPEPSDVDVSHSSMPNELNMHSSTAVSNLSTDMATPQPSEKRDNMLIPNDECVERVIEWHENTSNNILVETPSHHLDPSSPPIRIEVNGASLCTPEANLTADIGTSPNDNMPSILVSSYTPSLSVMQQNPQRSMLTKEQRDRLDSKFAPADVVRAGFSTLVASVTPLSVSGTFIKKSSKDKIKNHHNRYAAGSVASAMHEADSDNDDTDDTCNHTIFTNVSDCVHTSEMSDLLRIDEHGGHPLEHSRGLSNDSSSAQSTVPFKRVSSINGNSDVYSASIRLSKSILKAFPYVPSSEVVVDTFSCTYISGFHRVGMMHVTANYLLFLSPFLTEGVMIRLVDVERVEKLKTMVLLDGLTVSIRTDAMSLTGNQLLQAGGIVPASRVKLICTNEREINSVYTPSRTQTLDSTVDIESPESIVEVDSSPRNSGSQVNNASPNIPPSSECSQYYTKSLYTFTSLGSRDTAHSIITHFHNAHKARAEAAAAMLQDSEMGEFVHHEEGESEIVDPASGDTFEEKQDANVKSLPFSLTCDSPQLTVRAQVPPHEGRSYDCFITKTAIPYDDGIYIPCESYKDFDNVTTDYGTGLSNASCFFDNLKSGDSNMLLRTESVTFEKGIALFDVFRLYCDDDVTLQAKYHEERNDTKIEFEKWRPGLDANFTSPVSRGELASVGKKFPEAVGCGQRMVTCNTVLKALMGTICPATEMQKYAFMKLPVTAQHPVATSDNAGGCKKALMVQVSGQVTGVPLSDTFRAESLLIFEELRDVTESDITTGYDSPSSGTLFPPKSNASIRVKLTIYGYIQFLKSIWGMKGRIQSTAMRKEMPVAYELLVKLLHERFRAEMIHRNKVLEHAIGSDSGDTAAPVGEAESNTCLRCDALSSPVVSDVAFQQSAESRTSNTFRASFSPHNLFPSIFPCPLVSSQKHITAIQKTVACFVLVLGCTCLYWLSRAWWFLASYTRPIIPISSIESVILAQPLSGNIDVNAGERGECPTCNSQLVVTSCILLYDIFTYVVRPITLVVYTIGIMLSVSIVAEYIQVVMMSIL